MSTHTPTSTAIGRARRKRRSGRDRTRERSFQVVARSEDDAELVLARDHGVQYGVVYEDELGTRDENLRVRDIETTPLSNAPLGGRRLYKIKVVWRRPEPASDQPPGAISGAAGATYAWGRSEEQVEIERDVDGRAIQNSRGELYAPAHTVLRPSRTLEIRWYVNSFSMQDILAYDGVSNSDNWLIRGRWGVLPGQVLSRGIDPIEEEDGRTLMVWQLLFRSALMLWTPLEVIDYTLDEGRRVLLDGNGDELGSGEDGEAPKPVVAKVPVYTQLPFAVWGV